MFDFNDIHNGNAEIGFLDAEQMRYIHERVFAILLEDENDYPTRQEMETWPDHVWKPNSNNEFFTLISKICQIKSFSRCNLNWINTSDVQYMSNIFQYSDFQGDISRWDTRNVLNTTNMFFHSTFTGDISSWDMSKVRSTCQMFAYSWFDGDITEWDMSNVHDMRYMFYNNRAFNQDISGWNVGNVENMHMMFADTHYKRDLSAWVKNGYITLQNARDWGILKYMKHV